MKTKILIILIVLVGLGVGGFFAYKNIFVPGVGKEEVPPIVEEKAAVEKVQKEHYLVITKKDSSFYPLAEYLSEKKKAKLISYQFKFDEVLS